MFKKVKPLAKQTAQEAALTEHLIADGWERGWISQRILDDIMKAEKKLRSERK